MLPSCGWSTVVCGEWAYLTFSVRRNRAAMDRITGWVETLQTTGLWQSMFIRKVFSGPLVSASAGPA